MSDEHTTIATLRAEVKHLRSLLDGLEIQRQQERKQATRVAVRLWKTRDGYRSLLNDAEWEIAALREGLQRLRSAAEATPLVSLPWVLREVDDALRERVGGGGASCP